MLDLDDADALCKNPKFMFYQQNFLYQPSLPWVLHWKGEGALVTTIFSSNFLKLKCTKMCEFCAQTFVLYIERKRA